MMETERKIYRSKKDYILLGVCSGLANYFDVDPTLIRIIFIILALGGGVGILIYIILALVVPLEPREEKEERVEKPENKKVSRLGVVLLILGGLLLWNNFSPIKINSEIFWPMIMIVIGLWLVFKR